MLKLERILAFICVVESNSFSVAAKRLKISVPAVSKQITILESELGTRLIQRTTRRLTLTESGQTYYDQCKRLMEEVRETEDVASNLHSEPRGHLRAFVARYFGEKFVIPYLKEFMEMYPKIELDIELGERMPSPNQEAIDLIFGVSMAGPENWMQKKLAEKRYIFCASKEYLERYGVPQKPSDLVNHRYITHKMRRPDNVVEFNNDIKINVVPVLKLNDGRAMIECALNGLGIVQLHEYMVAEPIANNRLVEVLRKFGRPKIPIWVYFPTGRYLQPKVRKFIDFFSQKVN